jgi:ribose 5-phosphate isomerase B
MHIAIGSDHRGVEFKSKIIALLKSWCYECQDCGAYSEEPVDYPDIAAKVAYAVTAGEFDCGILICGTGIGMSIAANKIKGIRAALAYDEFTATRARLHNDANVLCLGSLGPGNVTAMLNAFLTTEFEGGRHQRRLEKISALEKKGRS